MAVLLLTQPYLFAQTIEDTITPQKVSEIIKELAGDSLKGRGNGTRELLRATIQIGKRFQTMGLKVVPGLPGMYLPFQIKESKEKVIQASSDSSYNPNFAHNVVACLVGKSKPSEIIIFSAHYDHDGVIKQKSDSIMNGANDNASGTTALLILAEYFAKRNDNERTLIFCAFAGEEIGLLGSKDFSNYLKPENIVAGINLEMLGISQYGKRRVFITGASESNLSSYLGRELKKQKIRIISEPDPKVKFLFYRSDNTPFARKGVPFHTIMASDDDDPCYHKPCDEIKRIDIDNLTILIQSIARACQPLISGRFTPSRINPNQLEENP